MGATFLFEIKKLFKDIKNILCIIFFIIFMIGFIYVNSQIDNKRKIEWKDNLNNQSMFISNEISEFTKVQQKILPKKDSKLDKQIKFLTEHNSIMSDIITAYNNKNLNGYLNKTKELDKHSIEGLNQNLKFNNIKSMQYYEQHIKKIDIMLKKSITPIFEENSMEGYNFLRLCSSNVVILILIVVMLNFTIECFSSEYEKKTYKLLFTQPISKTKIFFSKFFARLIVSFAILILVILTLFLILGLKNGFGNIEYPTEMYVNGKLVFVSLQEYLKKSIPTLLTCLFFIFSFCIFVSSIFNTTSIGLSFTILISVTLLCLGKIIKNLVPFIPFSYIKINDFLCSSDFVLKKSSILSPNTFVFPNNIYYLLIISIIFVSSSIVILNKKDI